MEAQELLEYYNSDYINLSDVMTPDERTRTETTYIMEMLSIQPGSRVLDIGCGYGRIAHELALSGAEVTGVDYVPAMIDKAKQRAAADRLTINYMLGEMTQIRGLTGFDSAIMWFFAFGHGDDRANARLLKAACAALKKGSFLLFDQHNTHLLARENYPSLVDRGNELFIHKPLPDLEAGRWGVERVVVRAGAIHRSTFSCRCYSPPELRRMIIGAGFRDVRFLSEDGRHYSPDSRKLIVVALK